MKNLAQRSSRGTTGLADTRTKKPSSLVIGSIPGLERLLPGRYTPGETVPSSYGSWTLPRSFKGREITAIVNGTMFG